MLRTIFTVAAVIFGLQAFAQKESVHTIPDGLYLVVLVDTAAEQVDTLSSKEVAIHFSQLFEDFNSEEHLRLIIDTTDYVPLELEKAPTAEQQTESKKKLMLSLTKEASEKLKTFTARQVMKPVALVVDGEALTMHQIKEPLTSGQLQITRCSDNACERLFVVLQDNITGK